MATFTASRRMVTTPPDKAPVVFTIVVNMKEIAPDPALNEARLEMAKSILADARFAMVYTMLLDNGESLWQDTCEGITARAFFS